MLYITPVHLQFPCSPTRAIFRDFEVVEKGLHVKRTQNIPHLMRTILGISLSLDTEPFSFSRVYSFHLVRPSETDPR